ncbi:MAG: methyl-accepting chemotaxis protein [Pseudomonadota bacterium]
MSSLADLSFRTKIAIPLLIVAALSLIGGGIGLYSLKTLGERGDDIAKSRLPALDVLLQADRDLYQAQVAELALLLQPAGTAQNPKLLKQHAENIQQAYDRVNRFRQYSHDRDELALVDQFNERFQTWREASERLVKRSSEASEDRAALIAESMGKTGALFQEARDAIDKLTETVEEHTKADVALIDETRKNGRLGLGAALAVTLALCLLMVLMIPPLLTRPLHAMLQRVEELARGNGDLTARIRIESQDEVGRLGSALNSMLATLQNLVGEVAGSTVQVASAATELSAITQATSETVVEQHAATTRVASALSGTTASAHDIARNADEASSSAQEADQHALHGHQVVAETVHAIQELAADMENTSEAIQRLASGTQSIGGVLDVIKSIAEQTNLLALNAAIEAARAGEQGRGFAVVADEVRTLASRTQASTQEIQGMIEGLQTAALNAVKVMEVARGKTHRSVDQARHGGEALDAITGAVASIRHMNSQIAQAAQEQSTVSESIDRDLSAIRSLAERTAEGTEQISTASHELARLSENLRRLVGNFKV